MILRSLLVVATPTVDILAGCLDEHPSVLVRHLQNDRSFLQNIVSFIGLFCKRDL